MEKWSSIEQFRHVVKYVQSWAEYHEQPLPTLMFRGTVKLHGTNAGIKRHKGEFTAQGRTRELFVGDDNYGFANWLHEGLKDPTFASEINTMFDNVCSEPDAEVTIYGEWCGKGIQKKVAIAELDKRFVVFGARVNGDYVEITQGVNMPSFDSVDNILVAGTFLLSIDFSEPAKALEELEKLTLQVEEKCPYTALYGVDGIGEGIVWNCVEFMENSDLWFKTKGEKHSGKGDKKRNVATIDPEKLEKISDLVDYVLSSSRLQQGLEHVESLEMKNMGQYLKWVGQDVQKEEMDTIEANGLEWKDVNKHINTKARQFFMDQVNSDF